MYVQRGEEILDPLPIERVPKGPRGLAGGSLSLPIPPPPDGTGAVGSIAAVASVRDRSMSRRLAATLPPIYLHRIVPIYTMFRFTDKERRVGVYDGSGMILLAGEIHANYGGYIMSKMYVAPPYYYL